MQYINIFEINKEADHIMGQRSKNMSNRKTSPYTFHAFPNRYPRFFFQVNCKSIMKTAIVFSYLAVSNFTLNI